MEISRNDLSGQKAGNSLLILRDYIVSAASQINAGGGSNGDNQDCPKCLHPYMKYNAKTKQPEPIFKSVVTGNVLKG